VVNGEYKYLRFTLDVDNGAGGHDVKFYTSDDGLNWPQLGATKTGAGITSVYDNTSPVRVGQYSTGDGHNVPGKVRWMELRDGIDGALVANPNPSLQAQPGDTSFTDDCGNTWTVNQSGDDPARLVAAGEIGLHYDGRIRHFRVDRNIAGRDGIGGLAQVFSEARLVNADGGLDGLLSDYALDGRVARLLVGDADASYAEFGIVFTGVVRSATIAENEVTLSFSDGMARLELPIQANRYLGTGGAEGGADLKGKPKPLCHGRAYNVAPVLVDAFNLVYQVHDGAIQDVPAFRDRGVALAKVPGAPAPGEYQVNAAAGTVTLGAMPDGEPTCDVEGDAPAAGYSERLAVILQRLLSGRLYTSEIDTTALANLNALIEAPVGLYVGAEERTVSSVLDELLYGAGCFGGFTRQGVFTAGRIADPTADAPVIDLDESSIARIERVAPPAPVDPIAWAVSVGWRRNYTVQSDIAALAADADRAFAVEAWRYSRAESAAVQSRRLLARELGPIESPFAEAADAESESQRLIALWGAERGHYLVDAFAQGMLADIGRTLLLRHPRHRLQYGRAARVLGQSIEMSRTQLRVLV
jgi:hypothetical protein